MKEIVAVMKEIFLVVILLAFVGGGLKKTNEKKKKMEEAVLESGKAIILNPEFAAAYYNRGVVKYSLNNLDEAISDFDRANKLDPEFENPIKN